MKLVLLLIIDDLYWFIKVQTVVQPSRLEMAICKLFTEDDLHFVVQVPVTWFNDNKV